MTDRKNGARIRSEIEKQGRISSGNRSELKRIVSEARLSGVPKDELIKLVNEYYGG